MRAATDHPTNGRMRRPNIGLDVHPEALGLLTQTRRSWVTAAPSARRRARPRPADERRLPRATRRRRRRISRLDSIKTRACADPSPDRSVNWANDASGCVPRPFECIGERRRERSAKLAEGPHRRCPKGLHPPVAEAAAGERFSPDRDLPFGLLLEGSKLIGYSPCAAFSAVPSGNNPGSDRVWLPS